MLMTQCPVRDCKTPLTDADQALGLCPACGQPLPVLGQELLDRHKKNLNAWAPHVKIVEMT